MPHLTLPGRIRHIGISTRLMVSQIREATRQLEIYIPFAVN
jgi:hypothetical protein